MCQRRGGYRDYIRAQSRNFFRFLFDFFRRILTYIPSISLAFPRKLYISFEVPQISSLISDLRLQERVQLFLALLLNRHYG